MMAEQAVTATWQSCKVVMLHDDKNADNHQSCHRIKKSSKQISPFTLITCSIGNGSV
ncbi:hypothetical protein Lser_V15G43512 [Lactuca serriola]